jgi:hypothetical protein
MGKYFIHMRRRIKVECVQTPPIDIAAAMAREKELAALREAARLEGERARSEKEERARARKAKKQESLDLDSFARRRTAARAAGLVLISATAGLRTLAISIRRPARASLSGLWRANIEFEIEAGHAHYLNDPVTPPEIDGIHLMRVLAPGIAERQLTGQSFADGADSNNMRTADRLAESYLLKTCPASSPPSDSRGDMKRAVVRSFQAVVEQRLRFFRAELDEIVTALMYKSKISRADCDGALARVLRGFDEHYRCDPKPRLFRPPNAAAQAQGRCRPRAP